MAILVGVILGSEGTCCPCSTTPPCSDCKTKEPPPPPTESCDCNSQGLYNSPSCGGECKFDCNASSIDDCLECVYVGPCDPTKITSQGCYTCAPTGAPCTSCGFQVSDSCAEGNHAVEVGACGTTCYKCVEDTPDCNCDKFGHYPPGTDCKAIGYEGGDPITEECDDGSIISCLDCYCYPCSEYDYQESSNCPPGFHAEVRTPCPNFTCYECVENTPECYCGLCGGLADSCGTCECEVTPCTCPDGSDLSCCHCYIPFCTEFDYQDSPICGPGEIAIPREISGTCGSRTCYLCVQEGSGCCCPGETNDSCPSECCCCPRGQHPVDYGGGTCICQP